jgi:hypothetical protein
MFATNSKPANTATANPLSGLFGSSNAPAANGQSGGIMQELLYGVVFVAILFMVLILTEVIYKYIHRLSMNRTELIPNTCMMDSNPKQLIQNPNSTDKNAKPIHLSHNERSGIEFSYSFYINADPSVFRQEDGLLHIFHKGYASQFPLLGPGVYMRSHTNTLRIYMNTFQTWNKYIDVENFPVSKWVHVAIVCKENALEVFINGNLSKKMPFEGYVPYQNYEDIWCFSDRIIAMKPTLSGTPTGPASLDDTGFNVFGKMRGMMSRLYYFSYALCYSEIQELMGMGPSSKMDSSNMNDKPPYLSDTWWANGY